MKVIQSRKNQLYKQIESVQQVNEEAEKVNLVSLSKTQFKLKYSNPPEETDGQQNPARTSNP